MRVVITGATGTIGARLVAALDGEGEVTVLSRDPEQAKRKLAADRFVAWNGRAAITPSVFERSDVVFHLAGEPVASGRWTETKKERIRESRVTGTRAIVDAIRESGARPRLVTASAVGYYGARGDELLTEESPSGSGFLADVCRAWEAEATSGERHGIRTTMLRIGIVLAQAGGALAPMVPLFRAGLGGRLGRGEQWMPWIHLDDVVGLFRFAAASPTLVGPVNAVAPEVVTNAAFTTQLARALRRPAILPAPAFAIRWAMGELAQVVLASQRVVPERAVRAGFAFRHPTLGGALAELFPRSALAGQTAVPS
jgi:uncharacterized protein (TIGR01777 family)